MVRNIKTLERNYEIKGNTAVIREKVEKTATKEDLIREIQQYEISQQRIIAQMNQLKGQYERIEELKAQVQEILNNFGESKTEMPKIGGEEKHG